MYTLALITLATLTQGDLQTCNDICESVLLDQSIITRYPNCICFSNQQKPRRSHVRLDDTPFVRVDDSVTYYEPTDVHPFQTLPYYDKSLHTINPSNIYPLQGKIINKDKPKTHKIKIPSIVYEQSFDIDTIKNQEISSNIVNKREKSPNLKTSPLYLDIDVIDWDNSRRSSLQNINKIEDFQAIEQNLKECIDLYIFLFLRHNNSSNLNKLRETWRSKHFNMYDNMSDLELQKEIEVQCTKPTYIIEQSLQDVKTMLRNRKEGTFEAINNDNDKVSIESNDIYLKFNGKNAGIENEKSEAITSTKPIESLKIMTTDGQIETDADNMDLSNEIQSTELQIQEKLVHQTKVKNSITENNTNKLTRSTFKLTNATDAVINLTDKINDFTFTPIGKDTETIYTTKGPSTKSTQFHTTNLLKPTEYNEEHKSQTDFESSHLDEITSSLFIETTTIKNLFKNDELLIETQTTPYSEELEINSHGLENKTNIIQSINSEHLNTTINNSVLVTSNHSINKYISGQDFDNKSNALLHKENHGEYRENEIPILKIITREFPNNTVVSSINGNEEVPNNDFINNDSDILSISSINLNDNSNNASTNIYSTNYTGNVQRNWETFTNTENFSEKADITGNIYFLSGQEQIPARFIQKPSGELHIGIDGITLCEKIKSANKSVLLNTLCNNIKSNNCTEV